MNRYDLMEALNSVDEEQIEAAGRFFESGKENDMRRKTIRTVRIVLIAAAITALLGATAYAAGILGLKGRVTEPEETFPVRFEVEGEDPIVGNWTGTYALEFDSPETCQPVRYRFGWLPDGVEVPAYELDEDGWVKRYDWTEDYTGIPWGEHTETHGEGEQYFISDMFYAPQFVNGGALILLDQVPGEITQETWGELSVLRFTAESWRRYTGEQVAYDIPRNFVLLFHPEQGWIFALRGPFPMEDLVKIAENTEIVQTEGLVEQSQYQNPYDFFDAAQG